jgi:hypothetical protein
MEIIIYYYKSPNVSLMLYGDVKKEEMNKTHVEVYRDIVEFPINFSILDALEDLFCRFNDYETNPLSYDHSPKKQEFIKHNSLHTSMSVGDAVQINNEIWACKMQGWEKI